MKHLFFLLSALLWGCAPTPCSPSDLALGELVLSCRARVERECPDLQPGECSPDRPCHQCPAVDECFYLIDNRCEQ